MLCVVSVTDCCLLLKYTIHDQMLVEALAKKCEMMIIALYTETCSIHDTLKS